MFFPNKQFCLIIEDILNKFVLTLSQMHRGRTKFLPSCVQPLQKGCQLDVQDKANIQLAIGKEAN